MRNSELHILPRFTSVTLGPGNERFTNELIELELNELNAGLLWHLL